jgi:hypothetical protein
MHDKIHKFLSFRKVNSMKSGKKIKKMSKKHRLEAWEGEEVKRSHKWACHGCLSMIEFFLLFKIKYVKNKLFYGIFDVNVFIKFSMSEFRNLLRFLSSSIPPM